MRYPVVIHKDKSSDYGVTVPDLPGCFSAGETMEDALTHVVEAIECHLEGLLFDGEVIPEAQSIEVHHKNKNFSFDGEVIPEAQSIEVHHKNKNFSGGTWALVSVDLSKLASKTKRINITLPERVLALVDEQAKREGESRSGLLARAVLDYIGRNKVA
jgi:predicted RNase H-like HicB family nuclease